MEVPMKVPMMAPMMAPMMLQMMVPPKLALFVSKKIHKMSEYRWENIMFKPADSTFRGMLIAVIGSKSLLLYFMNYFSDDISQELAFKTNQYRML